MKASYYLVILGLLFFSCGKTTPVKLAEIRDKLTEIPVDMNQNSLLPLSEIAEEISAIELELTDASLLSTDHIQRVFISDSYIFVANIGKILVFNKDGKYLHSIGTSGQGPGEYNGIQNVAFDEKNKRFILFPFLPKILFYNFDGKFLKESPQPVKAILHPAMNYVDDQLFIIVEHDPQFENQKLLKKYSLYRLNDRFEIADSCIILKNSIETGGRFVFSVFTGDFIVKGNNAVYVYFPEKSLDKRVQHTFDEIVFRDTLYRYEGNQLVPDLKLKFKNDRIDWTGQKFIDLQNIYRSSRYVFAEYSNNQNDNKYHFCYDTKTGKGYNMQDGYTDDINGIEQKVKIRPLITDSEIFYYLHTHLKPDDLEEPNPTLYIIKLKK